jgi:hypothetical protein
MYVPQLLAHRDTEIMQVVCIVLGSSLCTSGVCEYGVSVVLSDISSDTIAITLIEGSKKQC